MNKAKAAKPNSAIGFSDINITTSVPPTNEHTSAAVESLARAATANAEAIMAIAKALQGGNAVGINVSDVQASIN